MLCKERNQKICQKSSVNFNRILWSAHNDPGDVPYINGKLQESTFQNFLRIVNTYFGEEVMTVWVVEGQSARISDLDQNFYYEVQTTLTSPWTSFEGFITLITAEKRRRLERRTKRLERRTKRLERRQRSLIIRTSIVADSHKEAAKPSLISPSSTVYLSFVIFYSPCVSLQPCVADFS